jgi:transposase
VYCTSKSNKERSAIVKKYVVDLSEEEKERLDELTSKGTTTGARRLRRAHTLLLANEGMVDKEIARVLNSSVSTVERVRRRFVEEGLEAALSERPRLGAALRRKLDGKAQAYLVALACSEAPEGRRRWTMQMLADKMVEVGVVQEICDETVRRTLKKGTLSRG